MFKKALAIIMSLLVLASFAGLTASASGDAPTCLYVGEKNKTKHNLITKYEDEGVITVYSIKDSKTYYSLDCVDGEYVLTFENYEYSEPVEKSGNKYGLYCDGDLTVVLKGDTKFDLNKHPDKEGAVTDACGFYVEGTLTIVGDKGFATDSLTVSGNKKKSSGPKDSIGIRAGNLIIDNATVNAYGGYAGVVANGTMAVVDAKFNSNNTDDMYTVDSATGKKVPQFTYGIAADIFVQGAKKFSGTYCVVAVGGNVNVNSYYKENDCPAEKDANDETQGDISKLKSIFDEGVVVYLTTYEILKTVEGVYKKGDKFKIINKDIPECFYTATDKDSKYLSVSGKEAEVIGGDGVASVGIYLDCGDTQLCFDKKIIGCERTLLQKIIDFISYYIFFGWLFAKI